ncbi:MAG: efflux RND transporter permease subunit, partial [Solirubrobacteraceae bacterium]
MLWVLLYGALIAYGAHALTAIPVEVLPPFDFPEISVIVHDPGATATDLESLIVRPLEGRILTLPNGAGVRSTMGHGTVETDVRFRQGTNAEQDLHAVQTAIDRARAQLPPGVHPYAEIIGNAINEVADYTAAIPPAAAPAEVERLVRTRLVPALRALPGVRLVEVYGTGDESLWVQPDLHALRRYGVPVTALVRAVRAQVLLDPGGFLAIGHQHVLIEARHLPTRASDLADATVAGPHGPIPLGNLARIVRAPIPTQNAVRLDGHPSIALTVFKQAGASTVPVTEA